MPRVFPGNSASRFGFFVYGGVVGYRFADQLARLLVAYRKVYRIAYGAVEIRYIVKSVFVYRGGDVFVGFIVVTPVFVVFVVDAQREIVGFIAFAYFA